MKVLGFVFLFMLLFSGCQHEQARYEQIELSFRSGRVDTVGVRVTSDAAGRPLIRLARDGAMIVNGKVIATGVEQYEVLYGRWER
jgi:hypothetical protein